MNKDLRLSKVLQIVILAIILILISLNISQLRLLLLLIPVPFALIGTLSNLTNSIASLIIIFLALAYMIKPIQAMDIFINSIVPGLIIGIIAKKVIREKDSNKYEPIFMGSIVFIIAIIAYYFMYKYAFKIDILNEFLQILDKGLESQKDVLKSAGNELLKSDTFRKIIPSVLFFRSMILSIIIYLIEIFLLRRNMMIYRK